MGWVKAKVFFAEMQNVIHLQRTERLGVQNEAHFFPFFSLAFSPLCITVKVKICFAWFHMYNGYLFLVFSYSQEYGTENKN